MFLKLALRDYEKRIRRLEESTSSKSHTSLSKSHERPRISKSLALYIHIFHFFHFVVISYTITDFFARLILNLQLYPYTDLPYLSNVTMIIVPCNSITIKPLILSRSSSFNHEVTEYIAIDNNLWTATEYECFQTTELCLQTKLNFSKTHLT